MGKLFGTDGIRGIAGEELTSSLALHVGQSLSAVLCKRCAGKPRVLIGKDTRISSDMLESALCAGLCAAGSDVILLGVVPTPAVAFLVKKLSADAGVVISASHNSAEHNGIKVFNSEGFKLSDELEEEIEGLVLSDLWIKASKTGADLGVKKSEKSAFEEYINHIASASADVSGIRVAIDCANGSASTTAKKVFSKIGADFDIFCDKPDGWNINYGCGSTHLENLRNIVLNGSYDIGIAFDGDADRCLAVDELGNEIDGDKIMAVLAKHMKDKGKLTGNTVVATVYSNLGLHCYARENDIKVLCAKAGDRYVLEEMQKGGYSLGGEKSGHIIALDFATTGDGQLTAALLLSLLKESGKKASEVFSKIEMYPQVLRGIEVPNNSKNVLAQKPQVAAAIREGEEILGSEGRILVRPSGTEALVRVMVEGKSLSEINRVCDMISNSIKALLV